MLLALLSQNSPVVIVDLLLLVVLPCCHKLLYQQVFAAELHVPFGQSLLQRAATAHSQHTVSTSHNLNMAIKAFTW